MVFDVFLFSMFQYWMFDLVVLDSLGVWISRRCIEVTSIWWILNAWCATRFCNGWFHVILPLVDYRDWVKRELADLLFEDNRFMNTKSTTLWIPKTLDSTICRCSFKFGLARFLKQIYEDDADTTLAMKTESNEKIMVELLLDRCKIIRVFLWARQSNFYISINDLSLFGVINGHLEINAVPDTPLVFHFR